MILPRHVRSGRIPKICCAPPVAARKPEITSSNTSSDAVAIAEAAQSLQKPVRAAAPAPCCRRSARRRSPRSRPLFAWTHALDRLEVVVAGDERVARGRGGDARARRHAERQRAGARLHEKRVGVPVIAPFELQDLVAPRRRARHAGRAHGRLGAGADEAHPLHRRHQHRDALRQPRLELGRARRSSCRGRPPPPSAFSSPFGACPWMSGPHDIT